MWGGECSLSRCRIRAETGERIYLPQSLHGLIANPAITEGREALQELRSSTILPDKPSTALKWPTLLLSPSS
jgi:hypothetical protein